MQNIRTNAGLSSVAYLAQANALREAAEAADDRNAAGLANRLRVEADRAEARAYRMENEMRRQAKAKRRVAIVVEVFGR